jgi:hypothetical protein
LFRTITAYGGTYKFDGKTGRTLYRYCLERDFGWDQTGSDVTREGDRLTLTTAPFPFHTGKVSVNMLVFERVK